ncbi:MAG: hypothetical protein HOF01_10685 [Chloroflexi bacterium]|jgi:hypothetical protein|nr:hypothetical protein [Chloroflexota bacterium]
MIFVFSGSDYYHIDKMCRFIGSRNRPYVEEMDKSELEKYAYEPCSTCAVEKNQPPVQSKVTKLDEVGDGEHDEYFFKTRRKGYFNEHMKFIEDDEVWVKENGMPGVIARAPGYKKSVRGSEDEYHYQVKFWPESDPTNVSTSIYPESHLEPRGK